MILLPWYRKVKLTNLALCQTYDLIWYKEKPCNKNEQFVRMLLKEKFSALLCFAFSPVFQEQIK